MNILTWLSKGLSFFTNNRLKSGIIFDLETQITEIVFTTDPWRYFLFYGFDVVLNQLVQSEVTLYPDSKYQQLRESIVGRPGTGPISFRSVVETQIVTNNATNRVQTDATRERDRAMICLTPLIWVAAHIVAFDPVARRIFTQQAINQQFIPAIVVELIKRTRNCENGFYRWTTAITTYSWTRLVAAVPALQNSFYDPDFMRTEGGIERFLSFCQFLGLRSEQNYVKMVTPSRENLPPLESSYMVTANAYSCGRTHDFLRTLVYITANSQNAPSFIMMADTICASCYYANPNGFEYLGHQITSFRTRGNATSLQWSEHIVLRVVGEQPNNNNTMNAQQAEVNNNNDSRKSSKPRQVAPAPAGSAEETTAKIIDTLRSEMRSMIYDLLKPKKQFYYNKKIFHPNFKKQLTPVPTS